MGHIARVIRITHKVKHDIHQQALITAVPCGAIVLRNPLFKYFSCFKELMRIDNL
jgi:hypothetical protein